MKDAVATMGGLLPDDAGGRDAVHVAVFSAFSSQTLRPGQRISKISDDGQDTEVSSIGEEIAIVDPFLSGKVMPGQRFWAYLLPRTITALSHKWSHPSFEDDSNAVYVPPATKLTSEQWLREFCDKSDVPSYEHVIDIISRGKDGAQRIPDYGVEYYWEEDYITFMGSDAHCTIPPEFWVHVENVLGHKVDGPKVPYFSCSC